MEETNTSGKLKEKDWNPAKAEIVEDPGREIREHPETDLLHVRTWEIG